MNDGEVTSGATAARGPGLAAALVVPAALLMVDPAGWYPFGPLKVTAVAVAVLAGVALAGSPARSARPALLVASALVALLSLAALFGLDPLYAWTGTPERRAGVLLWVVAAAALALGASVGQVWVGRGFLAAGLGTGLLGAAEVLGWEPSLFDAGARITGAMGSSAFLGAACALVLPVVVGQAVEKSIRWSLRVAAAIASVLLAVSVVATGARSAWSGLAVAGIVTLLARPGRLPVKVALAGAGVAVTVLVLVLTPAGSRLVDLGDTDAPGGRGRADEWRIAARVVADRPIVGVGPEGYRIAFGEHADDRYEIAHGRDPLPDRAHSAPLDMALAGGVPAALAWLAFWGVVARRAGPLLRRGSPAAAGAVAGLIAHVVGQVTLFPLAELEPVTWLLAGAVLAGPAPGGTSDLGGETCPGGTSHLGGKTWPGNAVRGLAAVAALVALVAGVQEVRADRAARLAADALADGLGRDALSDADRAARLRPDVIRLHLLRSRAMVAADRGTHEALGAVADAEQVSPRDPVVQRERLRLLVARAEATGLPRHAAEASREVFEAVEGDRSSADLWMLAGRAAWLDGDRSAALDAYRRAEVLSPGQPEAALAIAALQAETGNRSEAEAALGRARSAAPDDPRIAEIEGVLGDG